MPQEKTPLTAGVVGLGAMGHQMARHMRAAGIAVQGFDLCPAASAKAAAEGIAIAPGIAELGAASDVVYLVVQTDSQVQSITGEQGLLAAMRPGSVICIAASVSPQTCREIEARASGAGIAVLDTTLILGQKAADEGRLTVFVGGQAETLDKIRPQLSCFGRKIHLIGPIGTGQIAKTANNMLLWACICANYEALSLARRMGVDIPTLIDALADSSGANNSLSRWGQSTGKWAEKDMDIALDMAQNAALPVPLSALVDQLMKGMDNEKMRALFD